MTWRKNLPILLTKPHIRKTNWNWRNLDFLSHFKRKPENQYFLGFAKSWLGSIESEWRKWGSSKKIDFESFCLFLLLAACCKSEVGNFLFLQGKVFNQISTNRWLTNSRLDKQRTLRILNMVGCHIWIRKGDILELFFCRRSSKSLTYHISKIHPNKNQLKKDWVEL